MSLILNEYDWAEHMIETHDLGANPMETLGRVSKYYYANHYSKREIRSLLDSFLIQCDRNVSLVKWADALDKLAKNVDKSKLIMLDKISITKPEIDIIKSIHGKQMQRLAFTLLCVAKYWDTVSDRNNHWVNTSDHEIMQMANVHPTIQRQSMMFGALHDLGLINFARRVDNTNVQVLYVTEGDVVLQISDFRNLGYQYLKFLGDNTYYECACCGIVTKGKAKCDNRGRPPKYCASCLAEVQTQQKINWAMRRKSQLLS